MRIPLFLLRCFQEYAQKTMATKGPMFIGKLDDDTDQSHTWSIISNRFFYVHLDRIMASEGERQYHNCHSLSLCIPIDGQYIEWIKQNNIPKPFLKRPRSIYLRRKGDKYRIQLYTKDTVVTIKKEPRAHWMKVRTFIQRKTIKEPISVVVLSIHFNKKRITK